MIVRVWRGWTTASNADGYEELIRSTIFPDILNRGIDGLLRLDPEEASRRGHSPAAHGLVPMPLTKPLNLKMAN